jgi:hypothetical protein
MNLHALSVNPFFCVLAGSALLCACGPSFFDQQVQNARTAQARGDYAQAAGHWDAACAAEPGDQEACTNSKAVAEQVKNASLEGARPVCAQGELDQCLAKLSDIRRLRPQDAAVHAVLVQGETQWRSRCAKFGRPGSLDSVLARLECVHAKQATVADADYNTIVREERDHAALLFVQAQATLPRLAGSGPGTGYAYKATATCLAPRIGSRKAAEEAARDLLDRSAQTIGVRVKSAGQAQLSPATREPCSAVAAELGPKARCAAGTSLPSSPDFVADMTVSVGRVDHQVTEEMRVAHYQSGVNRAVNPGRESAEYNVSRAERAFNDVEQETMDRKSECDRTRSQYACNRYNASVPVYNRRVEERNEARNHLQNTPAVVETPVFTDVPYKIRHHTWKLPYSIEGHLLSSAVGRGESYEGELSKQDDEHPSVPAAGVEGDPLNAPSFDELEGKIRERQVKMAAVVIDRGFTDQAKCTGAPWTFDAPTLECKVTSALYTSRGIPQPGLWLKSAKCE